jgi:hypothetical protein
VLILAPLGDLVGVIRQTNVLAYQLGNGLTNVFIPTQGCFMAALGILKIPWTTWVRAVLRGEHLVSSLFEGVARGNRKPFCDQQERRHRLLFLFPGNRDEVPRHGRNRSDM